GAVHIVILTTFELDEYDFEGLRAGAYGFLVKDTDAAELIRAVRVVADGEALLSPTVTRRLIAAFAARTREARSRPGLAELTRGAGGGWRSGRRASAKWSRSSPSGSPTRRSRARSM